jgi:hypothetical protein
MGVTRYLPRTTRNSLQPCLQRVETLADKG